MGKWGKSILIAVACYLKWRNIALNRGEVTRTEIGALDVALIRESEIYSIGLRRMWSKGLDHRWMKFNHFWDVDIAVRWKQCWQSWWQGMCNFCKTEMLFGKGHRIPKLLENSFQRHLMIGEGQDFCRQTVSFDNFLMLFPFHMLGLWRFVYICIIFHNILRTLERTLMLVVFLL